MCGIAGAVSTHLKPEVVASAVISMQQALHHRGPDDHGDVSFPDFAACLAHTRLAIIDLSSDAHQPMASRDARYTICYNGEIYNYQELRDELIAGGVEFHSHSDTEVILQMYISEGPSLLDKLRGMYAFFIWDNQEKLGFAARDPLGIKPLYFWHDQHSLAFASELKALQQTDLVSSSLDNQGLASYFRSGSVAEPKTLFKDVTLLPAGHYFKWHDGNFELTQFAALEFLRNNDSVEHAVQTTREALQDSVAAHLVSDVPVGLFLSGGIDSTAILALASQISSAPINTYSIAFAEAQWNEGDIAKRVAEHFGSKHTEWLMTRELAKQMFEEFLSAIDQPTIDGFNTFCVSKLAQQHGQKVVLSGLGGDEIFAGYKSFTLVPKIQNWSRRLAWFKPAIVGFNSLTGKYLPSRVARLLDALSQPNSISAAYQSLRGIFSQAESAALLQQYACPGAPDPLQNLSGSTQADQISELELSCYMRNQLLRDSDVMSMACGLELRVPFVDYTLLQTISKIPADIRLQSGKQLLIKAVPEIPHWVVERPKQGFRFPFDEWLGDSWGTLTGDTNLPSWIKLSPWYRRWSLLVLEHCLRRST